LFDINFLKKEKIYTKLKYSRSPQYDIVSGGVAALFAGFLGFLISEKFGIELVDSGDFYTFFMYIVFLCFATRPFFRILSKKNTLYHFISLKYLIDYIYTIIFLIFNFFINRYY
jgi:succinate-acetate transporter protein